MRLFLFLLALAAAPAAFAQRYELYPFLGFRYGGTFNTRAIPSNVESTARMDSDMSGGVSAGIRFREDSQVAFRWARRSSGLQFNPATATASSATLNDFQGEFSNEYNVPDYDWMKVFIAGNLGMTQVSLPDRTFNRFSFGVGGGFKFFPKPRYGVRLQMMYLPVVMNPESRGPNYTVFGPFLHQFEFSFGPVFRF